eukprot:m.936206 g.936206  ORF g.936206 m.936206 type:complete len:115 (+) comp23808_c0_seq3:258-602(+)
MMLTITDIQCHGLDTISTDGSNGHTDPYVKFSVNNGGTATTSVQWNVAEATWQEELNLAIPETLKEPYTITFVLSDKDSRANDDTFASGSLLVKGLDVKLRIVYGVSAHPSMLN